MRWQTLQEEAAETGGLSPGREPTEGRHPGAATEVLPLALADAVVRRFDTPQFRGATFYEVRARSVLNRVPDASAVPFRWTVNPYRGCTHACVYCFARGTHTYLELDPGAGFDSQVVVKVNAAEVLRRELSRPRWTREHVAMGTNVDCYQRAEGRYRLMPGIIAALRDTRTPFSILTKGTLVLRDLDLLTEAAAVVDVSTAVSVGFLDADLWRAVEPGTPSPARRLEACAALNTAGVPCGVLMAPILPFLSDSPAQLEAVLRAAAEAGATHASPIVLHLRPGAREWWARWLGEHHPDLVPRYRELYGQGSYAPRAYTDEVYGRVRAAAERLGLAAAPALGRRRGGPPPPVAAEGPTQLSLL